MDNAEKKLSSTPGYEPYDAKKKTIKIHWQGIVNADRSSSKKAHTQPDSGECRPAHFLDLFYQTLSDIFPRSTSISLATFSSNRSRSDRSSISVPAMIVLRLPHPTQSQLTGIEGPLWQVVEDKIAGLFPSSHLAIGSQSRCSTC